MGKKASNKQNVKKQAALGKSTRKQGGSFPATTVGIIVFIIVIVALVYSWNNAPSISAGVPSGNVCQENIDYLQAGVDSYREAFGVFPTTLEQLMESRDGKGPFVETIALRCPSSRKPYIIEDGVVRDSN